MRAFDKPRTIEAGSIFASGGKKYGFTGNGLKLTDMKCDEYTDSKGF